MRMSMGVSSTFTHVHAHAELKLRILDFYNQKLDLRYRMRKFAVENELIDAKKVCTTL